MRDLYLLSKTQPGLQRITLTRTTEEASQKQLRDTMKTIFLLVLVLFAWIPCLSAYSFGQSKCPGNDSQLPLSKGICTRYTSMHLKAQSNVSFLCPLNGTSYAFYKIGSRFKKKISPVKAKYIMSGNNLEIKKLVLKDAGQYMCKAKNKNNGNVSRSYWLLILHRKPSGMKPPVDREQPVGGTVVFYCPNQITSAGIKTSYKLLYRSVADAKTQLVNRGIRLRRYINGVYQLSPVEAQDAGLYYCGYKTAVGLKRVKPLIHLIVRDLPQIPDSSKNKDVWLGKSAHLVCKYKGPQTISWYKDGKEITVGVKSTNIDKHWKSIELFLKRVKASDAGDYECRVTIGGKVAKQHTKLGVYGVSVVPNRILGEMMDDGTIYINCFLCNSTQATYLLLHRPFNSKTYTEVNKSRYIFYQDLPSNIFILTNLKKKDEGFYKCKATLNGESIEDQPNAMWFSS